MDLYIEYERIIDKTYMWQRKRRKVHEKREGLSLHAVYSEQRYPVLQSFDKRS
jgi:hypothetical protein